MRFYGPKDTYILYFLGKKKKSQTGWWKHVHHKFLLNSDYRKCHFSFSPTFFPVHSGLVTGTPTKKSEIQVHFDCIFWWLKLIFPLLTYFKTHLGGSSLVLMKFHLVLTHCWPEEGNKAASANTLSQNAQWKGTLPSPPLSGGYAIGFPQQLPHDSCIMEIQGWTHISPSWEWPACCVAQFCSSSPPTLSESKNAWTSSSKSRVAAAPLCSGVSFWPCESQFISM